MAAPSSGYGAGHIADLCKVVQRGWNGTSEPVEAEVQVGQRGQLPHRRRNAPLQMIVLQCHARPFPRDIQHNSPNSSQLLSLVTLITGAGGLTLGGIAVTLTLATPIFLVLMPALVPIGIMVALATGGFLLGSTVFVGFYSFVSWIYNYVRGQKPMGADHIDVARHMIADTASQVTDKAQEVTGYLQSKAHEAAPGA